MSSLIKTTDGSTTRVIPSKNAVEMGDSQHISKKIGKISKFKRKIKSKIGKIEEKLKPKTWPEKSVLFVSKHWKFFLTPLIIFAILAPAMSYLSDTSPPITINYISPSVLEYGDESNCLDWEISGLDGFGIRYALYLDDVEIDDGKIEKNGDSYSYPLNDSDLSPGFYDFKLELKNSKINVINLVSLSIENYAPVIDCIQEKKTFEAISPDVIEFSIDDMSVNTPYYEYSLIDRYSNEIIDEENQNFTVGENLVFPISDFEKGFYRINITAYDGMGLHTSTFKDFSVVENLAPQITPSFEKGMDVELGEIFCGYFDVSDDNITEGGMYLMTLDENNVNPIASGVWDGGDHYEFSIDTEDLSLGYHSVCLIVEDRVGETAISKIDFDLKYTKDPLVSIDSLLNFDADYENHNLLFTVRDFELYKNASFEISVNSHKSSGYLIQFIDQKYGIDPLLEKLDIDYIIEKPIESVPNEVQCEFDLQKYLNLGRNEVSLTVLDGKGGETEVDFIVTLEEPIVEQKFSFNFIDIISYLADHPFIFMLLLYPVMLAGKGLIFSYKRVKSAKGLIPSLVFEIKNQAIKIRQRKYKKRLKNKIALKKEEFEDSPEMAEERVNQYEQKEKEREGIERKIEELEEISRHELSDMKKIFNYNLSLLSQLKIDENRDESERIKEIELATKKHRFFILNHTLKSRLEIEIKTLKLVL